MKEGSHTQGCLLTVLDMRSPVARLHSIGKQITMREHGPFGEAGGTTSVLQHGQIIAGGLYRQVEDFNAFGGMHMEHLAHAVQGFVFTPLFIGQTRLWMFSVVLA